MVNPADLVELDPALEDILSMWGKETNAQAVEHYFGAYDLSRLGEINPNDTPVFPLVGKDANNVELQSSIVDGSKQCDNVSFPRGAAEEGLPVNTQGKKAIPRFQLSKGFEDLQNLGLAVSNSPVRISEGLPLITRVSLPREPQTLEGPFDQGPGELPAEVRETSDGPAKGQSSSGNVEAVLANQNTPQQEITTNGGISLTNSERITGRKGNGTQEEELGFKGAKRKSQRPIGSQELEGNLVLGMEVSIEEALAVAECTLVGRARGKKFSSEFLQVWGESCFVSDRPLQFEAQILGKGWFKLCFVDQASVEWVFQCNWHIGNIPILLKKWTPMFDAFKEKTDEFPVWIRVLGLPSFLWTEEVFKTIGNRLGVFLEADMSFLHTKDRTIARTLATLNLSRGLAKTINLQYKDYIFEQILDYEYLPFQCHLCHEYGHLAKGCPLM